jgi:hypothetical protein
MKLNIPYSQYFSSSWFRQGFGENFHQVSKCYPPSSLFWKFISVLSEKYKQQSRYLTQGLCAQFFAQFEYSIVTDIEFSNRMHDHDGVLGADDEVNV